MQTSDLKSNYFYEIDFIKTFAIISVVLLHILTMKGASKDILYDSFSVYHIWQAVPLFMLIFGFTFRLSLEKGQSLSSILYSRFIRLLIPLLIACLISFVPILFYEVNYPINWHIYIGQLPTRGPGNYFITLYFETILFFILLFYLVQRFKKYFVLIFVILLSVIGELIAFYINIDENYMYSSSVHRYLLLIVLGYYFYDYLIEKIDFKILFLGVLSAFLLLSYNFTHIPIWPYSENASAVLWGFQHLPYEFYTVVFALILILIYRKIQSKRTDFLVKIIGASSLHIFLVQMFVFFIAKQVGFELNVLYAFVILFISIGGGILWFKIEDIVLKRAAK